MAITPFKAMSFKKDDILTRDDMDQMQSNLQYVYDNTPRGRYFLDDKPVRDYRTTLVVGKERIVKPAKTNQGHGKVRFGANMFAPNCRPHISTGIITESGTEIFCVVNGPGEVNYPNADGFDIHITAIKSIEVAGDTEGAAKKKTQDRSEMGIWVNWQAFGFREDWD